MPSCPTAPPWLRSPGLITSQISVLLLHWIYAGNLVLMHTNGPFFYVPSVIGMFYGPFGNKPVRWHDDSPTRRQDRNRVDKCIASCQRNVLSANWLFLSVTGPHQSLNSSLMLSAMLITAVLNPCNSLRHSRLLAETTEEELKNSCFFFKKIARKCKPNLDIGMCIPRSGNIVNSPSSIKLELSLISDKH